jgi:hypothetical protein
MTVWRRDQKRPLTRSGIRSAIQLTQAGLLALSSAVLTPTTSRIQGTASFGSANQKGSTPGRHQSSRCTTTVTNQKGLRRRNRPSQQATGT